MDRYYIIFHHLFLCKIIFLLPHDCFRYWEKTFPNPMRLQIAMNVKGNNTENINSVFQDNRFLIHKLT